MCVCVYVHYNYNLTAIKKLKSETAFAAAPTIDLIDERKMKIREGWIGESRRGKSSPRIFNVAGASRYLVAILSEAESRVYPPSRYYPLELLQKLWTADRPAAAAGVRLIHLGPSHMTG